MNANGALSSLRYVSTCLCGTSRHSYGVFCEIGHSVHCLPCEPLLQGRQAHWAACSCDPACRAEQVWPPWNVLSPGPTPPAIYKVPSVFTRKRGAFGVRDSNAACLRLNFRAHIPYFIQSMPSLGQRYTRRLLSEGPQFAAALRVSRRFLFVGPARIATTLRIIGQTLSRRPSPAEGHRALNSWFEGKVLPCTRTVACWRARIATRRR